MVEEYEYPTGRAETLPSHAHGEIQICLSLDFPGRYAYRGRLHEVPIGAVSVLDAWEPHAASDPCDRDRLSHYLVVYVDPKGFRNAAEIAEGSPIADPIRTDAPTVWRFRALYEALTSGTTALEQDERYEALASDLLVHNRRAVRGVAPTSLVRARDYIAAHATEKIGIRDAAAQADLSPWHFVRAFRKQFGLPPHRFQLWMRIEAARGLLAAGMPGSEVAQATGFADQSHFVRAFKRMMRMTPGQYRGV